MNEEMNINKKKSKCKIIAIIIVLLCVIAVAISLVFMINGGLFDLGNDVEEPVVEEVEEKPEEEKVYLFNDGMLPVYEDGKWGYINEQGEYVIESRFDNAGDFSDGVAWVTVDGLSGVIDKKGNYVFLPQFDNVFYYTNSMYVPTGDFAPCQGNFVDGISKVSVGDKDGYINKRGKFIVEPQFDVAYDFSDGVAWVMVDGKMGVINKKGKFIFEPQFTWYMPGFNSEFVDGISRVVKDGKYGFINTEGEYIVRPQFEDAFDFYDGVAFVKKGEKWGLINEKGKYVIKPQFEWVTRFDENVSVVYVSDFEGSAMINTKGEYVLEPQTEFEFMDLSLYTSSASNYGPFELGCVMGKVDGDIGFMNTKGEIVDSDEEWDQIYVDRARKNMDGLAAIHEDDQYGYMNKSGKYIIEPQFEETKEFSKGRAAVKRGGYWGYIDTEGNEITEFNYSRAFSFTDDGYAIVQKEDGKYTIIDTDGEEIATVDGFYHKEIYNEAGIY